MSAYNAEVVQHNLTSFRGYFEALTPQEQAEMLQCLLKQVVLHEDKVCLDIFELPELVPGSKNRTKWLPGLDSNHAGARTIRVSDTPRFGFRSQSKYHRST